MSGWWLERAGGGGIQDSGGNLYDSGREGWIIQQTTKKKKNIEKSILYRLDGAHDER